MATGSGLDAQLGVASESTWGTAVTVTRFLEFNSESLALEPEWLEPTGLRAGTKYKRSGRVRQSRKMVTGDVSLEWATKGMGLLVKHMLGSTAAAVQIGATTAWQQHHVPGDHRGLGLTVQVGRPEPGTGTVRPHTFAGCKVNEWEFSLEDNAVPTLSLTVDGRSEDTATALATASYLTGASVFDFSQATLKLGGTVTTSSGVTSVAGGTAAATVIRSITIGGESPKDGERFGIGNAGLKSEPLENDHPTITGSLAAEFSKTELYDKFVANTATALQLTLVGAQIEAGHNFELDFILPSVRFKTAAPSVEGPEIVQMETEFESYSDETNPVIQIRIKSTETTI